MSAPMSAHPGSGQPVTTRGSSQPQYRCCGETFSSWISYHEHNTKPGRNCEVCRQKLTHLDNYDKHLQKHKRKMNQPAASESHDFLEPLVSPEVQKIRRAERAKVRQEKRRQQEEKEKQEAGGGRQEGKRKRQEAERKRLEPERKRLKREKPVQCHLCPKGFKTPAAYAQHLESNSKNHPNVNRHHVTQAVHMLDVVPPITLAPSINSEYQPSTLGHAESVTSSSAISPFTSVPSSPGTDVDGSWILLGDEDSIAGSVVLASSVSTGLSRVADSPPVSHIFSPPDEPTTYTPSDFTNLGIPYACPICFKTFRTVVGLTRHMNSPVHDPDAFKCPKPECGRQFALVSGLIQHLESGTCKLASAGEIFERFALLTAGFSKYLAA